MPDLQQIFSARGLPLWRANLIDEAHRAKFLALQGDDGKFVDDFRAKFDALMSEWQDSGKVTADDED